MTPDEVERLRKHVEAVEYRDREEASFEFAVCTKWIEHFPAERSTPAAMIWIVNLPEPYRTKARAEVDDWQAHHPRPMPFDTPARIAADLLESLVMLEREDGSKRDAWERTHRRYLDRVLAFHLIVPGVEVDTRLHGNAGDARAGLQGIRRWCEAADAAVQGTGPREATVGDLVERVGNTLHMSAWGMCEVERLSRRMDASIGYLFPGAAEYERWTGLNDADGRFAALSGLLATAIRLEWPDREVSRREWEAEPMLDHEDPGRLAQRVDGLLANRPYLLQAVGDLAEAMGWHGKPDAWTDAVRVVVAGVYEWIKPAAASGKPGERGINETARLTAAWLVRRAENPACREAMGRHADTVVQLAAVLEDHCPAGVDARRPVLPWSVTTDGDDAVEDPGPAGDAKRSEDVRGESAGVVIDAEVAEAVLDAAGRLEASVEPLIESRRRVAEAKASLRESGGGDTAFERLEWEARAVEQHAGEALRREWAAALPGVSRAAAAWGMDTRPFHHALDELVADDAKLAAVVAATEAVSRRAMDVIDAEDMRREANAHAAALARLKAMSWGLAGVLVKAEGSEATAVPVVKLPPEPTAKERQVLSLHFLMGCSQREAAAEVWGGKDQQYRVSRAKAKAQKYALALQLPGTEAWLASLANEGPRAKIIPVDPQKLELGRRRDGRRA